MLLLSEKLSQLKSVLILVAIAMLASACGPNWVVIKQADPNPLKGKKSFAVESFDWGDSKPEKDHKKAIHKAYMEELKDEGEPLKFKKKAGKGDIILRTKVTMLEGGISAGIMSSTAELHVTVQLLDGDEVLDEIQLRSEADQSDAPSINGIPLGGYSQEQRLETCAEKLADDLAEYLETRTRG